MSKYTDAFDNINASGQAKSKAVENLQQTASRKEKVKSKLHTALLVISALVLVTVSTVITEVFKPANDKGESIYRMGETFTAKDGGFATFSDIRAEISDLDEAYIRVNGNFGFNEFSVKPEEVKLYCTVNDSLKFVFDADKTKELSLADLHFDGKKAETAGEVNLVFTADNETYNSLKQLAETVPDGQIKLRMGCFAMTSFVFNLHEIIF